MSPILVAAGVLLAALALWFVARSPGTRRSSRAWDV